MNNKYKILVVDDVPKIRWSLCDYLSSHGYKVFNAKNGLEAVEIASAESPDLIIMDVLMPEMNGLEACREIRYFSDVPVLFLSALGEEEDMLKGFDCGADDYLVKPFPLPVLLKKSLVMLSRSKGAGSDNVLNYGELIINISNRTTELSGVHVSLSGKDFDLLLLLVGNRDKAVSRDYIINKIWGYDYFGDLRIVDTHIKQLRKALGSYGDHIKSVRGYGYKFTDK